MALKHPRVVISGAVIEIAGISLLIAVDWRIALGLFLIWFANLLLRATKA